MEEHIPMLWQIITGALGGIICLLVYIWQSTTLQFRKHIQELRERQSEYDKKLQELEVRIEKVLKEVSESQHEIQNNYNAKFKEITSILHSQHEEVIKEFAEVKTQAAEQRIFCNAVQEQKKRARK